MKAILKMGVRQLDLVTEYTGYMYDQVLSVYYAKARMYDASNRRFMAVDPVKGTVSDPQTMVQYTYCLDNPVKYVDPLGLAVTKWDKANLDAKEIKKIQDATDAWNEANAAGNEAAKKAAHAAAEKVRNEHRTGTERGTGDGNTIGIPAPKDEPPIPPKPEVLEDIPDVVYEVIADVVYNSSYDELISVAESVGGDWAEMAQIVINASTELDKLIALNQLKQKMVIEMARELVNGVGSVSTENDSFYQRSNRTFAEVEEIILDNLMPLSSPKKTVPLPIDDIEKRKYKTPDEAAIAFAEKWNEYSIYKGKEFAAAIYYVAEYETKTVTKYRVDIGPIKWFPYEETVVNKNVKVKEYFTYTDPQEGYADRISLQNIPTASKNGNLGYYEEAQIHTHGSYHAGYEYENGLRVWSESEDGFSTSDIAVMMEKRPDVNTYVVTQWGNLYKADSLDGKLGFGIDEMWANGKHIKDTDDINWNKVRDYEDTDYFKFITYTFNDTPLATGFASDPAAPKK